MPSSDTDDGRMPRSAQTPALPHGASSSLRWEDGLHSLTSDVYVRPARHSKPSFPHEIAGNVTRTATQQLPSVWPAPRPPSVLHVLRSPWYLSDARSAAAPTAAATASLPSPTLLSRTLQRQSRRPEPEAPMGPSCPARPEDTLYRRRDWSPRCSTNSLPFHLQSLHDARFSHHLHHAMVPFILRPRSRFHVLLRLQVMPVSLDDQRPRMRHHNGVFMLLPS